MLPEKVSHLLTTGNILYVGGSDPGNYTKIQDAVNNANNGDTIYVYSGKYYENVNINISIHLVGENKETTIIDSNGKSNVIHITANDVNMSGFTIQNSDLFEQFAGIYLSSDNCVITDNKIISHPESNGILIKSSYNKVTYNYFSNINIGINIAGNHDNYISDNTINHAGTIGIDINSNNNSVYNNNITKSNWGIQIDGGIDNVIYRNHVYNNGGGVFLHTSSNNLIYENTIENNRWEGIDANYETKDNLIYNNNFINNNRSIEDFTGNDSWDNGYPIGGNYWSDYTGTDENGDGIGDTSYDVAVYPHFNYDKYPLMEPFSNFRINPCGPYAALTNNPLQFNGFAYGGSPPYNWYWDFGDGTKSNEQTPSHTYTRIGKYTVTLTVNDEKNTKIFSTYAWIQKTNTPPYKPRISGPKLIETYSETYYTFDALDPNLGPIYYYIDWGDGSSKNWFGPFNSLDPQYISHYWNRQGTYIISAKVKDLFGAESDRATFNVYLIKHRAAIYDSNWLSFLERVPIIDKLLKNIG
jgi:nitrous oxidase accessory protein